MIALGVSHKFGFEVLFTLIDKIEHNLQDFFTVDVVFRGFQVLSKLRNVLLLEYFESLFVQLLYVLEDLSLFLLELLEAIFLSPVAEVCAEDEQVIVTVKVLL